jgi:hypothetical protein
VGATYVPWSELPEDLSGLIDGGIIDEDSLPENLKGIVYIKHCLDFIIQWK